MSRPYEGPMVQPGDLVSFVGRDGVMYTERWEEPKPPVYVQPTGWRRVLRALIPPRWREPLPVLRMDPLSRTQRMLEETHSTIAKLTKPRRRFRWPW